MELKFVLQMVKLAVYVTSSNKNKKLGMTDLVIPAFYLEVVLKTNAIVSWLYSLYSVVKLNNVPFLFDCKVYFIFNDLDISSIIFKPSPVLL